MIEEITKSFNNVIEKNELIMIDFYADWCEQCKILEPIINELDKKNIIKIFKVNIDKSSIHKKYNITSIPHFIFFKKGKILEQIETGLYNEDYFIEKINHLKK